MRADETSDDDTPPRTKVIETKYGEVQGRIFHLIKRKGPTEEVKSSTEFNSKDKPSIGIQLGDRN